MLTPIAIDMLHISPFEHVHQDKNVLLFLVLYPAYLKYTVNIHSLLLYHAQQKCVI